MGWQDILAGGLTGLATGNPLAYKNSKLEEMFKQFQMQKMTDELEMRKDMLNLEKQKAELALKHSKYTFQDIFGKNGTETQGSGIPVAGGESETGYGVPEGEPTTQVQKPFNVQDIMQKLTTSDVPFDVAAKAIPLLTSLQKESEEYATIPGTTALYGKKTGTVKETGLEGKPEKPVNVPAWADAMGLAKMGSAYHTAKGQKDFADYLATPKGQEEAVAFQTEYAKRNTVPGITYLQTSEGFVPMPNKGPNVPPIGQPTGFGKPIPSAAAEKIGGLEALKNNIASVKELYGFNTDKKNIGWVGPIAGRIGAIEEKYTGTASDEQVRFYAYVRDMKDALLRARSGAQINEQEYKRLVAFLPDETSPAPTFESRLQRFDDELTNIITTKTKALSEGGYGTQTKGKGQSILKRKPGESIDDYLKRTKQ